MLKCSSLTLLAFAFAAAACSDPPPPKTPAKSDEGVPANSLSNARMNGEEDPADREKREKAAARDGKSDPTQPYTEPVAGGSGGSTPGTAPANASAKGSKPAAGNNAAAATPPPAAGGGGKGAVSKAECNQVMDKYLELEISKNPELAGVPPEVIQQAKEMARQKHGDAPCTATRAQYTCAMAASSTAAWQKCMK